MISLRCMTRRGRSWRRDRGRILPHHATSDSGGWSARMGSYRNIGWAKLVSHIDRHAPPALSGSMTTDLRAVAGPLTELIGVAVLRPFEGSNVFTNTVAKMLESSITIRNAFGILALMEKRRTIRRADKGPRSRYTTASWPKHQTSKQYKGRAEDIQLKGRTRCRYPI
jgi:hypothetical protein